MNQLSIEPDAATRDAFIEAMQNCVVDAFIKATGNCDDHQVDQLRQIIPGSAHAYFACPSECNPHHMPYLMFCKGMMHQRVRGKLNA